MIWFRGLDILPLVTEWGLAPPFVDPVKALSYLRQFYIVAPRAIMPSIL